MHFQRLKLALSAGLLLALTACASLPPQQAFNREASANIKTIKVLPMRETEPQVFILHNPGASFGLIGGLIAEADLAAKRKKLREALAAANVDYVAAFKDRLTTAMATRGYTLVWPEPTVETTKSSRTANSLRKSYATIDGADAQLDINFGFVGYAAAGASKDAPYRPTVTVVAQMVTPDGKSKLFTETVIHHNVFNAQGAIVMQPETGVYTYPKFDDLEASGADAAAGLKQAVEAVADKIAAQL